MFHYWNSGEILELWKVVHSWLLSIYEIEIILHNICSIKSRHLTVDIFYLYINLCLNLHETQQKALYNSNLLTSSCRFNLSNFPKGITTALLLCKCQKILATRGKVCEAETLAGRIPFASLSSCISYHALCLDWTYKK